MPIEMAIDWDKVHEIIDWTNSIGWALLLAYEYRRIMRKDEERKSVLQVVPANEQQNRLQCRIPDS